MNTTDPGWRRWSPLLVSVGAGLFYGLFFRVLFAIPFAKHRIVFSAPVMPLMTLAFLVGVPWAMGYLVVREYLRARDSDSVRWYHWLFLPWAALALGLLVAIAMAWEGRICLVFASPIMMAFSLIGGVIGRSAWARMGDRSPGRLSAIAFPILFLLIEAQIPAADQIRIVRTEILIHAPASLVWDNIKSVRAIQPKELPGSWIHTVGFPDPIAATLSHEGVGGVRQASFTGGLVFTETVNQWDQNQDLRFSIRANTEAIPRTTLDEHVTIGGAMFDVLEGEYQLQSLPEGTLLVLTSRERLSTHFNAYAGQWTDAAMRAIQLQILQVLRRRCEAEVSTGT